MVFQRKLNIMRFHHDIIRIIVLLNLYLFSNCIYADVVDSLYMSLKTRSQVQEKIYLQLDNTCYFKGDTIWYKAYTLRADNLKPTDMSRILYVELLTPDGYLVERQQLVIDYDGASNGMFILFDSIYSGYYELRAYTKWNLNFNVVQRKYSRSDREWFYNKQLARDYYRDFEGLYSRVFPVYEKPVDSDYQTKYIVTRPKRRISSMKSNVKATFYPEGGHVVKGVTNRIAFEIVDQNGKGIETEVMIGAETVRTDMFGRAVATILPGHENGRMCLVYQGKRYEYRLPEPLSGGVSIHYDAINKNVRLESNNVKARAYAILCRGKLQVFERLKGTPVESISIKDSCLTTGVNEILIFDDNADVLCSRQFFVNNNDVGKQLDITISSKDGNDQRSHHIVQPYEKVSVEINNGDRQLKSACISVRDTQTDEPTYDDGNILTELLLTGDLRGFVAHPHYYFESEDADHTYALDRLMMIQGWRKYKHPEYFRYKPEKTLLYEGHVSESVDTLGYANRKSMVVNYAPGNTDYEPCYTGGFIEKDGLPYYPYVDITRYREDYAVTDIFTGKEIGNEVKRRKRRKKKKEIIVEAEIVKDHDIAGCTVRVDHHGRFAFQIPPYYGKAILFVTAYNKTDSIKKNLSSRNDKHKGNVYAGSDYYVHRDMFYPVFTSPYSWYQTHRPETSDNWTFMEDGPVEANNKLEGEHYLSNVTVRGRYRKSLHAFDKEKPAIVMDMYDLYNMCADYGVVFNVPDMNYLPVQIAHTLFGNMNSNMQIRVRAEAAGHYCFINYVNPTRNFGRSISVGEFAELMDFRRIKDVRIYTDYDMRNGVGKEENTSSPDVHIDYVYLPENGKRPTCRDRRYIYDGLAYPEEFYSPDYSSSIPDEPTDYRRTLYWNPNAKFDTDGNCLECFYGKSQGCRIKASACGISREGQIYFTR